ncbi:TPA: biotin/lipoyl-binding protein, partial [Raoultella ornithinolytica]|nr:biotin/lipoyl-binding protein [Raoultella ornithinolytica]
MIIAMLCLFKYTKRIDVVGEVITLPHPLNISSPQPGSVSRQSIQVGDVVKKGEVLFELDVSKSTDGGNVSDTNVAMVKAKIVNAEDIIAKLKVNKDGFIETTHRQILRYEHSLNETEKMLTTAQKGLTHIEKSLQNYSDY